MYRNIRQAVFALLGVVALTGVVAAQDKPADKTLEPSPSSDKPMERSTDKSGRTMDENAPVVGRIPLGVTIEEKSIVATGYRASKLVRSDVFNEKGEKVGKVEDVLVAPNGQLTVAIVDVGGFLGMGKHTVAVPVRQFSRVVPKGAVLPGATKDALKDMPQFEYTR